MPNLVVAAACAGIVACGSSDREGDCVYNQTRQLGTDVQVCEDGTWVDAAAPQNTPSTQEQQPDEDSTDEPDTTPEQTAPAPSSTTSSPAPPSAPPPPTEVPTEPDLAAPCTCAALPHQVVTCEAPSSVGCSARGGIGAETACRNRAQAELPYWAGQASSLETSYPPRYLQFFESDRASCTGQIEESFEDRYPIDVYRDDNCACPGNITCTIAVTTTFACR